MKFKASLPLNRIILFSPRVEELTSFYVNLFNLNISEEVKGEWVVLKSGLAELAIHKIGEGYKPDERQPFVTESNVKLVFQIRDNLEAFREQFLAEGLELGDIKSFEGINSLFLDGKDPDGNVFQIEQKLTPTS